MTTSAAWQTALDRLVMAPALTPHQARFLLDSLGVPPSQWLPPLLDAMASPDGLRAEGAVFLLECGLRPVLRDALNAFLQGPARLPIRAHVRTLFQYALVHGRHLPEADAELAPPAGQETAFLVEDVAREIAQMVPSPWQRARIAAESLVPDTPIPEDAITATVETLAQRLRVDAPRIWAELLVHPLTREAFRRAAETALAAPSAAAATQLELAIPQLMPGPLKDTAVAQAARHRAAATAPNWRARLGGPDAAGRFPCLLWADSPEPMAVAGLFPPEPGRQEMAFAKGADAEQVLVLAHQMEQSRGPLLDVPLEMALARTRLLGLAAPADAKAKSGKKKDKARAVEVPGLAEFLASASFPAAPPEAPLSAGDVAPDPALAQHPLLTRVMLPLRELSESVRESLDEELSRGKPWEDTLLASAKEFASKRGTVVRLATALDHAARLAEATGDPKARELAAASSSVAAAPSGSAFPFLLGLVRQTVQAAAQQVGPNPTARDMVRPEVLEDPNCPGIEVLALDLGAAALEAVYAQERIVDTIHEELLMGLCAEAGRQAARVVAAHPEGSPEEEALLAEASREAIKNAAPQLPSRQRRDITEACVAGWKQLLTRACRGACPQRCPANLTQPRPWGAFSLDHPALAKPWP